MLQTLARTLEMRGYLLAPVINNVSTADKDGAGHIPSSRRRVVTSSHRHIAKSCIIIITQQRVRQGVEMIFLGQ